MFFEIPSSTEWNFRNTKGFFNPNVFENIEKTIEFKKRALTSYKQELRKYPHPRSPEALKILAQRWGIANGCYHAEAFCLIRSLQ